MTQNAALSKPVTSKGKRLRYAAAGTAAAALLAAQITYTSGWEGTRYTPYRDSGGIWTVCQGHTGPDVIPGKTYTPAECDALLANDIRTHEAGLVQCIQNPDALSDKTYRAIMDWGFNVGVGAACSSTLVRKLNQNDIKGACEQLSRWVFVNGKVIAGLANRRINGTPGLQSEQSLCLEGLK